MVVELFGFLREEINARITDTGMSFSFVREVGEVLRYDLMVAMRLSNGIPTSFDANGSLDLDLDFTVPIPLPLEQVGKGVGALLEEININADTSMKNLELHVDTSLAAGFEIFIDSQKLRIGITEGMFAFEGIAYYMPDLVIESNITAFIASGINSAASFAAMVVEHILAHAREIFATIFNTVGDGLETFGNSLLKIGEDLGEDLSKISDELLVQPLTKAIDAIASFGEESFAETKEQFETLIAQLDVGAEKLMSQAEDALNDAKATAEGILNDAGTIVSDIVAEGEAAIAKAAEKVAEIASAIEEGVKATAEAVKRLNEDAAAEIAQFFSDARAYAEKVLDDIRKWGAALIDDAKALANRLMAEAERLWQEIEAILDELAQVAEDVGEEVVGFAEDVGTGIGQGLSDAGNAFVGLFS